ncbi:MAG: hypothetical protein ACXAC2_16460, partial [Candidatus Kariarchaeaceae archaeon]
MATADKSLKLSSMRSKIDKKLMGTLDDAGMFVSSIILKIKLFEDVTDQERHRCMNAIFHSFNKFNRSHSEQTSQTNDKSIMDNISSSKKIDIKKVLQLVEEVENP